MSGDAAGLYLHVPFCSRVCPYCDFAVRTGDRARRARYVDHLLAEFELHAEFPLLIDTIYFGGGTPSSLLPEQLARILEKARTTFRCAERTWIFLEVNPEDVSRQTAEAWRRIGVDTLSLGVQSLEAAGLTLLGRRHTPDDARRAVGLALDAGIPTVSIDLIYGLPGQSVEDWRQELDAVLELGAHHFSCYQLTIHARTRFGLLEKRGKLTQLPLDHQADLFKLTHRRLNAAGMAGYEVSQFALEPRHRSRHNLKYWNHTPYLGLGPAAHSYRDRRRWWNLARTDPWQERIERGERPVEGAETLDDRALALEALMTRLRTCEGVDPATLLDLCGIDILEKNTALVTRLREQGLLGAEEDRLVPTLDGLAVADGMAARFEL